MILALRPDLRFVEMRGNIDTRLRKWSEGQADALVLAAAGLDRLGRTESVHQRFAVDEICPAPGQGALALQVRCPHNPADTALHALVRTLNCPTTEFAVTAERAVLHALGGGCQLPLGAFTHLVDDVWHVHAMIVSADGDQIAHVSQQAPFNTPAEALGQQVAEALESRGALDILVPPDPLLLTP
jgi:hydroxymethylbilane synthase